MNNKEIGNRIKSRRKELKFTLQEIADKVGVASSTIQRYESGSISQLKLPVLESIAKAINVNPVWLVKEDAPMSTEISDDIFLNNYHKEIENNTIHTTINLKDFSFLNKRNLLLSSFDKLNELGKEEALKRVGELTEIGKYTEDKSYLEPLAAHDKDGNFTEEDYKRDMEVISNDDLWNE